MSTVVRLAAGALLTRHSLEWKSSIVCGLYGIAVMLNDGSTLKLPNTDPFGGALLGYHFTFGLWMLLIGIAGIYGLVCRNMHVRLFSTYLAVPSWGLLVVYYGMHHPPMSSAMVMYGTAAVAELWIYLRLKVLRELARQGEHE